YRCLMRSPSSSIGAASAQGCRSDGAKDVFTTPFYKHCAPPERKRLNMCRNLSWTVAVRPPNHFGEKHVQRLAFVVNDGSRLDRVCDGRFGSKLSAGLSSVARA